MNLRQAAQRALKEMDDHMYRADTHEFYEAKEALRAALAEHDRLEGIEAIEKAAGIHVSQQAEPEQEPVATWENKYGMKEWEVHAIRAGWMHAPTPRKPLTPDQVFAIADQHPVEGFDPEIMAFVRAIERAHGITGETK